MNWHSQRAQGSKCGILKKWTTSLQSIFMAEIFAYTNCPKEGETNGKFRVVKLISYDEERFVTCQDEEDTISIPQSYLYVNMCTEDLMKLPRTETYSALRASTICIDVGARLMDYLYDGNITYQDIKNEVIRLLENYPTYSDDWYVSQVVSNCLTLYTNKSTDSLTS